MKTWREIIAERRALGGQLTREERRRLHSYDTCLVGEQHLLHPEVVVYAPEIERHGAWGRPDVLVPVDDQLYSLGADAFNETGPGDLSKLETYLDQIEERVLQLKREEKPRS